MPILSLIRPVAALSLVIVGLTAGAGHALGSGESLDVRRLLTLLAGIREEYGEAHDEHGRVVRPIELDEARLLAADAIDSSRRLAEVVPAGFAGDLEALAALLGAGLSTEALAGRVDDLRMRLSTTTGVAADAVPPQRPSLERGALLYGDNCATCHGATGSGDGPDVAELDLDPANFTDHDFIRQETPQDFFNVISLGRRGRGMPAWDEVLSIQDRWDLVAHLWTLASGRPAAAGTQACGSCHLGGGGAGKLPNFSTTLSLAQHSDRDLFEASGSPPHDGLTEDDAWAAVAALRIVSLTGGPGAGAGQGPDGGTTTRGLDDARRLLHEAAEAARRGDPAARRLATDAYIAFEPFERRLRVRTPELVTRVEEAFVEFRMALHRQGPDVDDLAAAVDRELVAATVVLRPSADAHPAAVFGQAITIILREGFEVILIVGALLTYVRRRQPSLVPVIRNGALLGVAASVVTAVVLVTGLRHLPWAGEAIEGAAMLLASLVLFFVSYWLVSKAEAERWQHYIESRVSTALGEGSRTALASAAFLAVYREGFETVLFYQALLGTTSGGSGLVVAGAALGTLLLGGVYVLMARIGMRVPMGTFFVVTGTLLYAMAVVFAGRGVGELQEAGLVGITPVDGVPSWPTLGLQPTVETLVAQGILVGLLVYAMVTTIVRRRRTGAATALDTAVQVSPGAGATARVGRNGHGAAHVVAQPSGSPPAISPPEAPRGNGYA